VLEQPSRWGTLGEVEERVLALPLTTVDWAVLDATPRCRSMEEALWQCVPGTAVMFELKYTSPGPAGTPGPAGGAFGPGSGPSPAGRLGPSPAGRLGPSGWAFGPGSGPAGRLGPSGWAFGSGPGPGPLGGAFGPAPHTREPGTVDGASPAMARALAQDWAALNEHCVRDRAMADAAASSLGFAVCPDISTVHSDRESLAAASRDDSLPLHKTGLWMHSDQAMVFARRAAGAQAVTAASFVSSSPRAVRLSADARRTRLCYLLPGETLHVRAYAVVATAEVHSRWRPLDVTVRHEPVITVQPPLVPLSMALAYVQLCPAGVFDIEELVDHAARGPKSTREPEPGPDLGPKSGPGSEFEHRASWGADDGTASSVGSVGSETLRTERVRLRASRPGDCTLCRACTADGLAPFVDAKGSGSGSVTVTVDERPETRRNTMLTLCVLHDDTPRAPALWWARIRRFLRGEEPL
jgi:hypothetical protein